MRASQPGSSRSDRRKHLGFLAFWIVTASLLTGLRVRQLQCQPEYERCSREAEKWEKTQELLEEQLQLLRSRQATENPLYRRWAHLAKRASEIAKLYRADEVRWRCLIGADKTRNYVRELWIEPE
jgi:hypothetical protein